MATFFPKLVERCKHDFETSVYHDLEGISSGRQLANTPRFTEVLGWLRGGYTYTVSRNRAGALYMSY